MPTAVALDDATVAFRLADDRVYTAVEKANLSIAHGEFVAIVGPTGFGKSTLLDVTAVAQACLLLLRLNRSPISFSHGVRWNTLISRYIGTIPAKEEGSTPQIVAIPSPPGKLVMIAMAAKVGAAAIRSHAAMRRVSGLRRFSTTTESSA